MRTNNTFKFKIEKNIQKRLLNKFYWLSIGTLMLSLLFCSCRTVSNVQSLSNSTNIKLDRAIPVMILYSEDGAFGNEVYNGSGSIISNLLLRNFALYAENVFDLPNIHSLSELKATSNINNAYYVIPQILHWEERATEWSGIPSRISLKINIYDKSLNRLSGIILEGKSASMTLVRKSPDKLIEEDIQEYIQSLY